MALDTHDPEVQGGPRPVAGLFHSVNNFLATFVAIVHTRLELLTTELQEEVRQVGAILLWAFIAAFAVSRCQWHRCEIRFFSDMLNSSDLLLARWRSGASLTANR